MSNVAETILNQLGGNKFIVMTGSKNFLNLGNGLRMKLTRNKSKAQFLKIELTGSDLYNMTLFSARSTENDIILTTKEKVEGVYFDQMNRIFEQVTGLYTSL
jgi:hypothetical protein